MLLLTVHKQVGCIVKVPGVLCYGFDGTLIWGKHNRPESWNGG